MASVCAWSMISLAAVRVVGEPGLGPAQVHGQRHQPLLRAVVQVPLDPAAFCLGRIHHPGPALLQFGDPLGLVGAATRADQVAGHRDVQAGQPLGQPRGHGQQEQPEHGAGHHLAEVGDRRGNMPFVQQPPAEQRQPEQRQRERPGRGDDEPLGDAEREADHRVAELAAGGPLGHQPPQPPPQAGARAQIDRRGGQPHAEQHGEPGPLEPAELQAQPEHGDQHRQAGQEEPHRGHADRGQHDDPGQRDSAGDRPGHQVDDGQPGLGGHDGLSRAPQQPAGAPLRCGQRHGGHRPAFGHSILRCVPRPPSGVPAFDGRGPPGGGYPAGPRIRRVPSTTPNQGASRMSGRRPSPGR